MCVYNKDDNLMETNEFDILMDFPGWTKFHEIVHICNHISKHNVSNVLCAGTFGGRVASAICRSFPHIHVTAIDRFQYIESYKQLRERTYMTCGDRFLNERQSLEHFKSMHDYQNLTVMQIDFFDYKVKHDIVINEIYPYEDWYTWVDVFDHCMSLSDHVIGAWSQVDEFRGVYGREVLERVYNYEIVSQPDDYYHQIYRILSKKV